MVYDRQPIKTCDLPGADPGFFAGGGGNDGRVQWAPSVCFAIVKKFAGKKIGGREQGGPPPPGSVPAFI